MDTSIIQELINLVDCVGLIDDSEIPDMVQHIYDTGNKATREKAIKFAEQNGIKIKI